VRHAAQVRGGGGSCFGHGVMQPKPFLLERLVQPLRDMEGWRTVIGMHLRTGFSGACPPTEPALGACRLLVQQDAYPHTPHTAQCCGRAVSRRQSRLARRFAHFSAGGVGCRQT
jgi:hypothetical protein